MQARTVGRREDGQGATVGQHLDRALGPREDGRRSPVEEPLVAEHGGRAERVACARETEVAAFPLPAAPRARQQDEAILIERAEPELRADGQERRGPRIEAPEQERVDLAAVCRMGLRKEQRGGQTDPDVRLRMFGKSPRLHTERASMVRP